MTATQPIAVLRGAAADIDRIEALIERCADRETAHDPRAPTPRRRRSSSGPTAGGRASPTSSRSSTSAAAPTASPTYVDRAGRGGQGRRHRLRPAVRLGALRGRRGRGPAGPRHPGRLRRPRRADPDELVRGRRSAARRPASSSPPATTRGSTTGSRSRRRPAPPAAPTCSPRSRRASPSTATLAIDRRPLADAEAAGDSSSGSTRIDGLRAVRPPDARPRRAPGGRPARPRRPVVRRRVGLDRRACWPAAGSRSTRSTRSATRTSAASTRSRSGPTSTRRWRASPAAATTWACSSTAMPTGPARPTRPGTFIHQLQVTGLLMYYLAEHRGWRDPVVVSINNTSMAARLGEHYGIATHETPVGFKFIGPKMIETGAMMGAEESGGFGFGMHLPERDGIYADLLLLDLFLRERAAGRWPVSTADRRTSTSSPGRRSTGASTSTSTGRSTPRRSGGCSSTWPPTTPTELAGEPVARTVAARHRRRLQVLPRRRVVAAHPGVRHGAARAGLHRGDQRRPARGAARRRRAAGPRVMTDGGRGSTVAGSTSRGATS